MKNRILLSFDFPPLSGGISRLCDELAKQLAQAEPNRLTVLTETFGKRYIDTVVDYKVVRLTNARPSIEWQAYKYLRQIPEATVICATWYPEGFIALLSRKHKVVILTHGTEILPARNKVKRFFWNILAKWILAKANVVIANSQFTAGLTREMSPNSRVEALPLAVDIHKFVPAEKHQAKAHLKIKDKITLLTVARLHRYKGVETVLEAISQLSPLEKEKIQYFIAGTGPYLRSLVEKVKILNIESQVSVLGSLTDSELVKYYQASDLFLLCSWQEKVEQNVEGFGLVFLEAQASGTPALGTLSGGIPDAIENEVGGWLIPEKDEKLLAQILKRLIADPNELISQGIKARNRVINLYSWQAYLKNFLNLCQKYQF